MAETGTETLPQKQWIRIPSERKQVFFSTCVKCGETMYFTRPTGVNYGIHNPCHYRSKVCQSCREQYSVGPGGGKARLAFWLDLARQEGIQVSGRR